MTPLGLQPAQGACRICGGSLPVKKRRRGRYLRHCSAECRAEAKRRRQRAHYARTSAGDRSARRCPRCGARFTPSHASARYCGAKCARRAAQAAHDKRTGGNDPRRRARRAGVPYEPVDREVVFERDRWRCQICGRRTPQSLRGTLRPNAPEIDHRVPISKGGAHTYENVQCACRACNFAKRDRNSAGQMPLFARPSRRKRNG